MCLGSLNTDIKYPYYDMLFCILSLRNIIDSTHSWIPLTTYVEGIVCGENAQALRYEGILREGV